VSERRQAVEAVERERVTAPELSWAFRTASRAVLDMDASFARRLGMRRLDYTAMSHLMDEPGRLGPVDLSHRLGISTGSATELVDRLESGGHVRRVRHPDDRRRLVLEPTEDGVDHVLSTLAPLFAQMDALAAEFSPDEQAAIARYLREAAARMDAFAAVDV
jgi:DNA-binding MarR family transcriptional regulator